MVYVTSICWCVRFILVACVSYRALSSHLFLSHPFSVCGPVRGAESLHSLSLRMSGWDDLRAPPVFPFRIAGNLLKSQQGFSWTEPLSLGVQSHMPGLIGDNIPLARGQDYPSTRNVVVCLTPLRLNTQRTATRVKGASFLFHFDTSNRRDIRG